MYYICMCLCVCFIVSYIIYIYMYGHTCLYYIYRRYRVHLWGAKVSAFSASSWTGESESSAARTAPQVAWRSSAQPKLQKQAPGASRVDFEGKNHGKSWNIYKFTLIHSKLSLMIHDKNMWNHGLLYLKAKWVREFWNPTLQLYKDCWSFWTYLTVRWLFKMDSETGGTPDGSQIAFGDLQKELSPKT